MTCTPIRGREDFGGNDECEGVCAKVEQEVADGDEDDGGRGSGRAVDAVVDTAGDDEEEGEEEEGCGQPLAAGDAVGEEDEADAACNGGEGDGEEILLGLFDEDVVDGVAGVGGVGLPDGEAYGFPSGDSGCAAR